MSCSQLTDKIEVATPEIIEALVPKVNNILIIDILVAVFVSMPKKINDNTQNNILCVS